MGTTTVLMDKVKKELIAMWTAESTLPENTPGGLGGTVFPKNKVSIAIFIILTLILAGLFWNAGANTDTVSLPGGSGGGNVEPLNGGLDPINGHSEENTEQVMNISVDEAAIIKITFTLTWDDEQATTGFENYPDSFQLNVTTPWGASNQTDMEENDGNGHGEISLEFEAPGEYPDTQSAGDYDTIVRMGEAGDQWPIIIGPSGGFNDSGNDWTLTITYTYWGEAATPAPE